MILLISLWKTTVIKTTWHYLKLHYTSNKLFQPPTGDKELIINPIANSRKSLEINSSVVVCHLVTNLREGEPSITQEQRTQHFEVANTRKEVSVANDRL